MLGRAKCSFKFTLFAHPLSYIKSLNNITKRLHYFTFYNNVITMQYSVWQINFIILNGKKNLIKYSYILNINEVNPFSFLFKKFYSGFIISSSLLRSFCSFTPSTETHLCLALLFNVLRSNQSKLLKLYCPPFKLKKDCMFVGRLLFTTQNIASN